MNLLLLTYSLYLIFTSILTIWVARTLFKNGSVFLVEIFHRDKILAESVNKLLIVGFYLINLGYAIYTLKIMSQITNYAVMVEQLSLKVGAIILILGGMHFFNLFLLFTLRNRAKEEQLTQR